MTTNFGIEDRPDEAGRSDLAFHQQISLARADKIHASTDGRLLTVRPYNLTFGCKASLIHEAFNEPVQLAGNFVKLVSPFL